MSNLEKELLIRKAKYRVKNSEGKYEVVYLETSADQVEETNDRVFVTPEEKTQITSNKEAIAAETQARIEAVNEVSDRLDAVEGVTTDLEQIRTDIESNTNAITQEVSDREAAISNVESKLTAEVSRATQAETDLGLRIDEVEADLAEAVTNAAADATAKSAQALKDAKTYADEKIAEANSNVTELQGNISTLAGRVTVNEEAISDLRDAIANKNSNTIVVENESDIATANPQPKVGDLAFVITSKRAYIYKGVEALSVKSVPAGWVVFDEITSELDLVDYLKKSEAESTYRKLADKIAEGDLATELATKLNNKADKSYVDGELAKKTTESYVDSKVEEVVAPVRTESAQNKADIAKEVSDRQSEITRVEGLVSSAKTELTESVSDVDTKVEAVSTSLTEKEAALKAEDTKLNNRISKFAPVVSAEQPMDTEAGHVWLELI